MQKHIATDTIKSLTIQKSSGPSTKQYFLGYAAHKLVEKETWKRGPRLLEGYKAFMEDIVS